MNSNSFCAICEEPLKNKLSHILKCNHEFHYECLYKSFKQDWLKSCPYCRNENNSLPMVNGLKKIDENIHSNCDTNDYINIPCNHILLSGKNKGNVCGKNCILGEFKCISHKKFIKK